MHSAIAGRNQSRYLLGRSRNDTKDGRVAKHQNDDGQDETKNEQVNVIDSIGQGPRRVVPGTGDEQSLRFERRPAKQPR